MVKFALNIFARASTRCFKDSESRSRWERPKRTLTNASPFIPPHLRNSSCSDDHHVRWGIPKIWVDCMTFPEIAGFPLVYGESKNKTKSGIDDEFETFETLYLVFSVWTKFQFIFGLRNENCMKNKLPLFRIKIIVCDELICLADCRSAGLSVLSSCSSFFSTS